MFAGPHHHHGHGSRVYYMPSPMPRYEPVYDIHVEAPKQETATKATAADQSWWRRNEQTLLIGGIVLAGLFLLRRR